MKVRGFALIEIAIVLAVIAILAAVLTPLLMNYAEQGRIARAQGDVASIANAMRLYRRDTGRWPIYSSQATYDSQQCCGGTSSLIGSGAGSNPADGTAIWNVSTRISSTSLELFINGNLSNVTTAGSFPRPHFGGPYIGNLDADPWGHKYILTGANMFEDAIDHAFVISAGPNGQLDTENNQADQQPMVAGPDDIVAEIR